MRIVRASSKERALKQAAAELAELLQRRGPTLFLISGGSAFQILDHVNSALLDQRVTIGVLDERYSQDAQVNNFAQLQSTAFAAVARQRGAHFINTTVLDGESLEDLTQGFEQELNAWAKSHPEGHIIATMGMGRDGHTAGIMPFPENKSLFKRLFDDVKHWVSGYDAEGKNEFRYRVTVTLPFLRSELDAAVVLISGESKRPALERVEAEEGTTAQTPARVYREMRHVAIFTDIEK